MITNQQFASIMLEAELEAKEAIKDAKDEFPCGGAWLTTSGTSEIVKLFKKFGVKDSSGRYCYGQWHISKGTYRGYTLHGYFGEKYQSMRADINKYTAIQASLVKNGIGETNVYSYID